MDDVERSDRAWNRRLDIVAVFAVFMELFVATLEAIMGFWVFVPMLIVAAGMVIFSVRFRHWKLEERYPSS